MHHHSNTKFIYNFYFVFTHSLSFTQYNTNMSSATAPTTALSNNDTPDWKRHSCSAFLAGDEIVQVVPSFSTSAPLELLSVPRLGPFRAGVSTDMPLWLALLLEKRNLAKIVPPEWLSVETLRRVLQWEQTQDLFSPLLPFYWQPLARSLVLDARIQILIQDIATVRMDKIRRNLYTLSKQSLSQETTLPIVNVTGIGALELAAIYSFVQTSFGQHLKLSRPTSNNNNNIKSAGETRHEAMKSTENNEEEDSQEEEEEEDSGDEQETAAPSRLRRFR
jgi:GINS complex subunit 2